MIKHKNTIMLMFLLIIALVVSGCCSFSIGTSKIECDCDDWLDKHPNATCEEFTAWLEEQGSDYVTVCANKGPCANQRATTTTP